MVIIVHGPTSKFPSLGNTNILTYCLNSITGMFIIISSPDHFQKNILIHRRTTCRIEGGKEDEKIIQDRHVQVITLKKKRFSLFLVLFFLGILFSLL